MLTPAASALTRRNAPAAGQGTEPAVAGMMPVSVRPDRALLLLGLASRTAYLLYASVVVLLSLADYQHPGLAGAALAVAVFVSAGLGLRVWREQAFSGLVAVLDAAAALVVLVLVAAALRYPDRYGGLNWALTYAVACAVWLGLGGRLSWRIWPACVLGVVYGVTALRGSGVTPAMAVTVAVNGASIPMYFGIAATVTWVVRRVAGQIAARQAQEQAQRRDLAALAERERLVGEVHRSVLATLEEIASGQVPWAVLRGQAKAQVSGLRAAFGAPSGAAGSPGASGPPVAGGPSGASAGGCLRALLAGLAWDRSGDGWRIDVVDEDLTGEPAAAASGALRDALAELIAGMAPEGCPPVRAQVRAADGGTELVARIPRDERAMTGPVAAARARLAGAGGTAEPMPACPGEVRVLLRVPE